MCSLNRFVKIQTVDYCKLLVTNLHTVPLWSTAITSMFQLGLDGRINQLTANSKVTISFLLLKHAL